MKIDLEIEVSKTQTWVWSEQSSNLIKLEWTKLDLELEVSETQTGGKRSLELEVGLELV